MKAPRPPASEGRFGALPSVWHEAENFQRGDYSDPAQLHGEKMPGLEEMRAGAARIRVSYTALPTGAEISFETDDLELLTAIHRWFGAQLSEHGADARAE